VWIGGIALSDLTAEPGIEWRQHREGFGNSAMADVLGSVFGLAEAHKLEPVTTCCSPKGCAVVMDRGVPTEAVLAEMRASDPPVQYVVGTPKGRLNRSEPPRLSTRSASSKHAERDIEAVLQFRRKRHSSTQANTRTGPIHSAALVVASPSATPPATMALSAKRAPKRSRRSNCPLWRKSPRRPRAASDLLAHRLVPATVLDDLETGATAGGLLSEKHDRTEERLIRGQYENRL
jgi:hypothetical protein